LFNPWSDVVSELSNYLVFLGEEDENDLRDRLNYRLVQLVKASAALVPANPLPVESPADSSWGLFDESVAAVPDAVAKPIPTPEPPSVKVPEVRPVEAPSDSVLASHYLICLLGSQQYALPIHQVREILEERLEKALPSQREGIRGLVTVRGMVCPVVDVSQVLHAKVEATPDEDRKKRCLVVCEVDRRTFCFNVDDVKQVAALDEFDDQITPLHPENSIQKAISHVSHFQNKSVLFVKMREVIPA
jgi:chemotaxis signal transduction protein